MGEVLVSQNWQKNIMDQQNFFDIIAMNIIQTNIKIICTVLSRNSNHYCFDYTASMVRYNSSVS